MYRSDLNTKDKGGAIFAAAAINAALLFALLQASGRIDVTQPESVIRLFEVTEPPAPSEPLQRPEQQTERPKEAEGAASPENIRSRATPIVAPTPRIALPLPVPMATTQTPNQGAQPTQGAAEVRGPGTGAGGTGTGTGSGRAGSGTGGGGSGLAAVRTRLATPPLRGRDFPRELLDAWPRGAWARMRFRVDPNGYIIECVLDQRTGVPMIDTQICHIARERLRFRPALDRNGRRVADWAGYGQEPPR